MVSNEERFDFSEALRLLKKGYTVTRVGWNNAGIYVKLQRPDENSKMTEPYLYMEKIGDRINSGGGDIKRFPSGAIDSKPGVVAHKYSVMPDFNGTGRGVEIIFHLSPTGCA